MRVRISAIEDRNATVPLASGLLAVAMAWCLVLTVAAGLLILERTDAHFDLVLQRDVFSFTVYRDGASTRRGMNRGICTDLQPCGGNP